MGQPQLNEADDDVIEVSGGSVDTPESSNATRNIVAPRDPNAARNTVAGRTNNRYGEQTLSETKNKYINTEMQLLMPDAYRSVKFC